MRKFAWAASAAAVLTPALTAPAAAAGSGDNSIGYRLMSILQDSWSPVFFVIAAASAILGLIFLAKGLLKLRDASSANGRGGFGEGAAYIVAAAMLIALPDAAGVGLTTVWGSNSNATALTNIQSQIDVAGTGNMSGNTQNMLQGVVRNLSTPSTPKDCLSDTAPATCMAQNLAENAAPMAMKALFALVFLVGVFNFSGTIIDMTKASSSGRGALPQGWGMKLVTSILLMNAPLFFLTVSKTLLGSDDATVSIDGLNTGSSLLTYTATGGNAALQRYGEIIQHSFSILAFFGAWAFIRGVFMIKSVAEGRGSQGSYGMGGVYLVAGILLANAKFSSCMILYSIAGSDGSMGFCN